ncbi:Pilus assembly protein, PilO [Propionispira arboris]|uniref:Pilus assembly protein, PilO n=2 Tax=Propionispira arboris TaxID=84035 RepID=A0A1H6VWD0_9FIRM|nr:Pilus assembly protein, PilO [Propionispira arboris]
MKLLTKILRYLKLQQNLNKSGDIMKSKKLMYQLSFFLLGVILLSVTVYTFVYVPRQQELLDLTATVTEKETSVISIENFMNEHPDMAAYEQELRKKNDFLSQMLPNNMELSSFLSEVEKMAAASQVTLLQIKPNKLISKDNYQEIPILLEFQGNYFQILHFLRQIEAARRFNKGSHLSIQTQDGVLVCKLVLSIYSL